MSKRTFQYSLENLLTEYSEDIYNEVSERIQIELVKDTRIGWSASIKDGRAIITYRKANAPDACFAHELLHIKYELNGLKPPLIADNEEVTQFMPIIFNQLCHHKFYKEFYEMGFNEEEFLNDNDAQEISAMAERDLKMLEEIFQKTGVIQGSPLLLLPYLSLISPHDKSEKINGYIERLKRMGDKSFFESIDTIIQDWVDSPSLDSSLTFARLFKASNRARVGFCLTGREEDMIVAGNI